MLTGRYQQARSALRTVVVWVLSASLAFGIGGACMASSDGFGRAWPSLGALGCFLVGAALLTMAVRSQGLSTAYTVGLGLEAVLSVGLGRWLFGEQLHAPQFVGVGLILAGIATVRMG
jgi:multidrug transporter EmrE-like cation transporter